MDTAIQSEIRTPDDEPRRGISEDETPEGVSGRIVDTEGVAIRDARLILQVIDISHVGEFPDHTGADGWGSLLVEATAETDAEGTFQIVTEALSEEGRRDETKTILWCCASGFRVAAQELVIDGASLSLKADWVLEPSQGVHVLVLGGGGTPLQGATVTQVGRMPESSGSESQDASMRYAFSYHFEAETGSNGIALFPRKLGVSRFSCEHSGKEAWPWEGEPENEVILHLGSQVHLRGTVTVPDTGTFPDWEEVRVKVWSGRSGTLLAEEKVHSNGSWGPVSIPRPADGAVSVAATGREIHGPSVHVGSLQPEEQRAVPLSIEAGQTLWAFTCTPDLDPIYPAVVFAEWESPTGRRRKRSAPREDGYVKFTGMPKGAVLLSGQAKGMARSDVLVLLPESEPEAHAIQLLPGRAIQGICLNPDKSFCNSFNVYAWADNVPAAAFYESFQSVSGTFLLENLPMGGVSLMAVTDSGSSSAVVELTDGLAAGDVELRLVSGAQVTGQVVDTAGVPIFGAQIRSEKAEVDLGSLAHTDSRGEFALMAPFEGESTAFEIKAPGFSTKRLTHPVGREQFTRLPLQVLRKQLTAQVQVHFNPGESPWSYSVGCTHCDYAPVALNSEGVVVLLGMDAGPHNMELHAPDKSEHNIGIWLAEGGSNRAQLDLRSCGSLNVQFKGAPEGGETGFIVTIQELASGAAVGQMQEHFVPGGGLSVNFAKVIAGEYRVVATTYSRSFLASSVVTIAANSRQETQLDFESEGQTILVENPEGDPLSGVRVIMTVADGDASVERITNSEGLASFAGLTGGAYFANLAKPGVGHHWQIPVEIPLSPTVETVRITMECLSSIRLRLVDPTGPLTSKACKLMGYPYSVPVSEPKDTNQEGLVVFSNLGTGRFLFSTALQGHWPYTKDFQATENAPILEVLIPRLVTLSIQVQDANGAPIQGQHVQVWSEDYDKDTKYWQDIGAMTVEPADWKTNAAGQVHLPKFPEGHFTVSTNKPDGTRIETTIELRPGLDNVAVLRLP